MPAEGFNFRQTLGYVTDPVDTQFVVGTADYPTTSGGVTFGWTPSLGSQSRNRSSSVDARLAGVHQVALGGASKDFLIDLPASAGTYSVTIALGDAGYNNNQYLRVYDSDGTTLLVTLSGQNQAGYFFDAAGVMHAAADFFANQTPAILAFSGTQAIFRFGGAGTGAGNTTIAHISIESIGSGGTVHTGAAAFGGTGTAAATATAERKGAAAVSGSSSFTASARLVQPGAAALAGTSSLNATAHKVLPGTAMLAGAGSLTASGSRKATGTANLNGTSTLASTARAARNASAAMTGTGAMSASATTGSQVSAAALMAGTGTFAATATIRLGGAAGLAGTGTLSVAAPAATRAASAVLAGAGGLSALSTLEARASASLSGAGTFAASLAPDLSLPKSTARTAGSLIASRAAASPIRLRTSSSLRLWRRA